jgi:hypothetical protein
MDRTSLAGALELTLEADTAVNELNRDVALASAGKWAQENDLDVPDPQSYIDALGAADAEIVLPINGGGSLSLEVVNTCYSDNDSTWTGVAAEVTRPSETFLVGFLGVSGLDSAAYSLACAGRPISRSGFLPWTVKTDSACFTDANPDAGLPYGQPKFGFLCPLSVGADNSDGGTVGQLTFEDGSACADAGSGGSDYRQQIVTGVQVTCWAEIEEGGVVVDGDGANSEQGVEVGPSLQGIECRLKGTGCTGGLTAPPAAVLDGACETALLAQFADFEDTLHVRSGILNTYVASPPGHLLQSYDPDVDTNTQNGIDDFYEIWGPTVGTTVDPTAPASNLSAFACGNGQTSQRNVDLIIVENLEAGSVGDCTTKCHEVLGFARIYIEGCTTGATTLAELESGTVKFSPTCDKNDMDGGFGNSFTIWGRFVRQVELSPGDLGLANDFGAEIQVFLKE